MKTIILTLLLTLSVFAQTKWVYLGTAGETTFHLGDVNIKGEIVTFKGKATNEEAVMVSGFEANCAKREVFEVSRKINGKPVLIKRLKLALVEESAIAAAFAVVCPEEN